MKENLREIFNNWAIETQYKYLYRQWLLSKWECFEEIEWKEEKQALMLETILKSLDVNSTHCLLDLGCGGGWILERLKLKVKRILGVDFSFAMLQNARRISPETELVCAEISQLPFKDKTIDRILAYFVLINIESDQYIELAIKEMVRILKKGGKAFIGQLPDKVHSKEYDKAKDEYLKFCKKKYKIARNMCGNHLPFLRLFDRQELVKILEKFNIKYKFCDSFNPFYREGTSPTVPWRFDVVLEKV